MENRVEILEEEKESQGKQIDDLEQYSRRNCLLLHGVDELNDECTDEIIIKTYAEELGICVKQEDLDRSHRLVKVKRNDSKPQPIIVKFVGYEWMKLLDEPRQKYGVRNVWTYDGHVMYKKITKFL